MSTTVTASVTVTIGVQDVTTGGTIAGGDAIAFQETGTAYYGGTNPVATAAEWSADLTLAPSTPQTPSLLALAGPRGSTVTLASATLLYVSNTGAHPIVVGGAGSNPFLPGWDAGTDAITLQPGSRLLIEAAGTPWPVSSSACNLKFDPGANAGTCRVIILGN